MGLNEVVSRFTGSVDKPTRRGEGTVSIVTTPSTDSVAKCEGSSTMPLDGYTIVPTYLVVVLCLMLFGSWITTLFRKQNKRNI